MDEKWIYFKEKMPDDGQEVTVEWYYPFEGETDVIWENHFSFWAGGENTPEPEKWKLLNKQEN